MGAQRHILFVGYGGGHMRMLVPVARCLAARGMAVTLLPLNVGVKDARSSGLPMVTLGDVLDRFSDGDRLSALGASIAPTSGHPMITDRETHLYHGLGLADLIAERGEAEARQLFEDQGRKAFHPTLGWRRILQKLTPDLVVATNAPRSESAALAAARSLGIPALCVTDHFLVYEVDYVSRPGHGDLITVLGTAIAGFLARHGRPEGEIRVTGNPAFDALGDAAQQTAGRDWRGAAGWANNRLILWPQQSKATQVGGKALIPPEEIAPYLVAALDADPALRLIVRPHPNNPGGGIDTADPRIRIETAMSIEALIHAADIVVQQSTTVGIQAGLAGKPVVTIANRGMPPFAEYGLAKDVENPAALPAALAHAEPPDPTRLGAPAQGRATDLVADVAEELLA